MDAYFKISQLKENIYRINSPERVNADLFVGTEKALLLDTGYGFCNLKKKVREITDKPLMIVNTHGHMDHVCGNAWFDEEIYIHPKDLELAGTHSASEIRRWNISDARAHRDWEYEGVRDILPKDFSECRYLSMGSGNLLPLEKDQIFELGGITLRAVEVPGHTGGSIALLYEEENWIYLGDAMNPFLFLFGPESEKLSVYLQSIKRVRELQPSRMYISHSDSWLPPTDLELFQRCAENADYEKGVPFEHMLSADGKARVCTLPGFTMNDMGKPGFAAVVINPEKLDI